MDNLIVPTVNINGTDGKVLFDRYLDIMNKANELLDMMAEATPHGRDYQLKPETYKDARMQHTEMQLKISNVKNDITAIAVGIQEQL
jgi:hypothetical protein